MTGTVFRDQVRICGRKPAVLYSGFGADDPEIAADGSGLDPEFVYGFSRFQSVQYDQLVGHGL